MSQHPSRGGDGSSDSEDDSTGHAPNQVLPVANLPFDFDGIPRDGMEYLFTVRRDSRLLPRFTRIDHPSANTAQAAPTATNEQTNKTLHSAFPIEAWRTEYVARFMNYRRNLRRALDTLNAPGRSKLEYPPLKVQLPSWQNRNEWWHFITGSSHSLGNATGRGTAATNDTGIAVVLESERDEREPHEPTLSILRQFSLRNITSLLYWFSVWITVHSDALEESWVQSSGDESGNGKDGSGPASNNDTASSTRVIEGIHQRWMFALLGMLDTELVGNDISTLRELARAAIRLAQVLTKREGHPMVPPGESVGDGTASEEEAPASAAGDGGTQTTVASCWMIVGAIAGVWCQWDIWDEAREALSS